MILESHPPIAPGASRAFEGHSEWRREKCNDRGVHDGPAGADSGNEKWTLHSSFVTLHLQVPFRCVDEINQGMDEKNERAVWDQLLKVDIFSNLICRFLDKETSWQDGNPYQVCEQHEAQYFYMAPKFPYSLPFNDQVNHRPTLFLPWSSLHSI